MSKSSLPITNIKQILRSVSLFSTFFFHSLWLNEGFATYTMFESVSKMDWDISADMMYRYLTKRFQPAMISDSYKTSRPMHPVSLEHPKNIRDSFDSITYGKGMFYLKYKLQNK